MKNLIFTLLHLCSILFAQENNILLYPMHVGDYWQYKVIYNSDFDSEDTTYYSFKNIIGKVTIDGKSYYEIEIGTIGGLYIRSQYVRIDSLLNNVMIVEFNDEEYLSDSLDAEKGDYFNDFTQCIEIDSVEYFGKNVRRKIFYTAVIDNDREIHLAEGFGEIYRYQYEPVVVAADRKFYLTYARINGIEYGDSVTSVYSDQNKDVRIKLDSYPNPFNNQSTIDYSIPNESRVTIKLYDILGRSLRILVNEEKSAGNYNLKLNSDELSSGIYFLVLENENHIIANKLLLLK